MTITIAKLLDRKEYDVKFVVIGRQIGEIKEFIPDGYPLSIVKIRNIYDFTTIRIYYYLKQVRPDYVFCSLHYLNPRVIQASRWVGNCKVIVRFNCTARQVSGLLKRMTTITYPKADVVIAQTEGMQKDIVSTFHLSSDKVFVLHNLLDTKTIDDKLAIADSPYTDDLEKRVVFVGRIFKTKNLEMAIRAFVNASLLVSDLNLYIVGKFSEADEYFQSMKALSDRSGVSNKIHFVGFQSNPYKWMKYADCFLLSSITEGSPNVLFEALYLGIPAVTTRCTPNIDDIIQDGINGYKVDVGDDKAMSDRIIEALKLKKVKSFYKHSITSDFIKLFQ